MDRIEQLFFNEMKKQAFIQYEQGKSIREIEHYLSMADCPYNEIVDIIELIRCEEFNRYQKQRQEK